MQSPIVIEPQHQAEPRFAQRHAVAVLQADPAEVSVEIDDPARRGRGGLRRQRRGKRLEHRPLPGVQTRAQGAIGIQSMLRHQAGLILGNGLAGVLAERRRVHLPRISLHLSAGEAERILGKRLVKHVGHQRDPGVRVGAQADDAIELFAPGRAVIAIAVGLKA